MSCEHGICVDAEPAEPAEAYVHVPCSLCLRPAHGKVLRYRVKIPLMDDNDMTLLAIPEIGPAGLMITCRCETMECTKDGHGPPAIILCKRCSVAMTIRSGSA